MKHQCHPRLRARIAAEHSSRRLETPVGSIHCIAATRCDGHHTCCGESVATSRSCNTGGIHVHGLTRRTAYCLYRVAFPCHRLRRLQRSACPALGPFFRAASLFAASLRGSNAATRAGSLRAQANHDLQPAANHDPCRAAALRAHAPDRGTPAPPVTVDLFLQRSARSGSPAAGGVLSSSLRVGRRSGAPLRCVDARWLDSAEPGPGFASIGCSSVARIWRKRCTPTVLA